MSSINLDINKLECLIFDLLERRVHDNDTLHPRSLEVALAKSFNLTHTGDEDYYADAIVNNTQVSIKTISLSPIINKIKSSSDFQTNSEKFLGPIFVPKYNYYKNGIEIIQRRQALPFDDITSDAYQVGVATIDGFKTNLEESYRRYNTNTTYEVIATHGISINPKFYIVSVFWQKYDYLNPDKIIWEREKNKVSGYKSIKNNRYKVAERINGNAPRAATCFIEYKNLLKYKKHVNIKIPIPQLQELDMSAIKHRMEVLNKEYDANLFLF